MTSLLTGTELTELEALRRVFRSNVKSRAMGQKMSARRGSSAEFLEHRMYHAGDDIRRMDWLAFARLGEPVLKLFRAEEDTLLRIVVDQSESFQHGDPSKRDAANKLAAAFSYLALANSERTQVQNISTTLEASSDVVRGRGGLFSIFRFLDSKNKTQKAVLKKETHLEKALSEVLLSSKTPGIFLIFSDFFCKSNYQKEIKKARSLGHEIQLVQVLSKEEISPSLQGDLQLEDAETGECMDVTVDAASLLSYERNFHNFQASLSQLAKDVQGNFVSVRSDVSPISFFKERLLS